MFIDDNVNKDKVYLNLNQNVTSHYEIEDFRDYKSVDQYLKELIEYYDEIKVEEKENNYTLESLLDELAAFEDEMSNNNFELLMSEMNEK